MTYIKYGFKILLRCTKTWSTKIFSHITLSEYSIMLLMQITGKWTACHWSVADLRFVVQELLDQLTTCHIVFIPKRCNAEAHALANSAIQNSNYLFPKTRYYIQTS